MRIRPTETTMSMRILSTTFAAFLLILGSGCNSSLLNGRMDEGVIEYALTFPDHDPNGLMAGMLPESTTLTFAEGKQLAELSAGMGIFRTHMVVDNKGRAMDYHMSMMSKKIMAHLVSKDLDVINTGIPKPYLLFTNDVDTIAGFACKRAVAIFDRMDLPEVDIWYTEDISLDNANWFGPFSEVPGVMLSYEMVQYGLRMRLDAVKVTPGKVDPAKFNEKPEYERVDPAVLHHDMAEVLGAFSM